MKFASFSCKRATPGLDKDVNDKQPRASGRANITRLLWILGLITGLGIGTIAAIGLAGADLRTVMSSE
jgi:hypothetical protein